MISHSLITLAWMALAWLLHLTLDLSPWYFTAFILGVWWSREQYWEELKFRKLRRRDIRTILWTWVMVFRPIERNLDLLVPAAVAVVFAILISL